MNNKLRFMGALVLALTLALMPLAGVAAQEPVAQTPLDAFKGLFASAELYELAKAGGAETVEINLVVDEGTDVSKWVSDAIVRRPVAGMVGITGRVKANALGKVAAQPGVLSIRPLVVERQTMRPVPPEASAPALERGAKGLLGAAAPRLKLERADLSAGASSAAASPSSYIGVDVLGARAAWGLGYTGQGAIVGHLDDGCDFGHPDLEGTWATVNDATSPYDGWPLIYDAGPALLYVGYGEAFSWEAVWEEMLGGTYSYYADTTATPEITVSTSGITATAMITTVGYIDPPDYQTVGVLSHEYTFLNTSKSGVYHTGIHPDVMLSLFDYYGGYAAVLVVDEAMAGVYDTVYVDLDASYTFDWYERFTQQYPTGWYYDVEAEGWSRDATGDGVADVSAGIMYWIADGENVIPGTDVIYDPAYLEAPGAGDLVLFYGDYGPSNTHGTGTASAVVAQGVTTGTESADGTLIPEWADISGGTVLGTAPDAKLFSSNLFSVGTTDLDSWYVHAVGYDGVPGTGDEAQIDTNSWGYIVREDAWLHDESRLITRLNMIFPHTTWVISSGNGGTGYGSSSGPGTATTAIQVGGFDLNGTTLGFNEPIAGPEQILWGDLTPFSSRGPDTAGRGDVEIMSIADGATGAMPVMQVPYLAGALDGNMAFTEFGGTSQACPFAAGVAALAAEAYAQANGLWPDYATLKSILMSSATDANLDPFVQGAGRVNAKKAVEVAAGLGGFVVDPPQWDAGDYRGAKYLDFAYLVKPGSSDSQAFTVSNTGAAEMTVELSDTTLMKVGEWSTVLTTTVANEEPLRNLSKPDYLVPLYQKGGVNVIPAGTNLMVIDVSMAWDKFSLGDATDPTDMTIDSMWYMKALQWTDLNGNGVLWNDADGNGAVNDGELDNPPSTGDADMDNSSMEINEFSLDYTYGTTKEVRVASPLARGGDGLFIGLHHYTSSAREIGKPIPVTPLKIVVSFYQQLDVDWLDTSATSLTVGAGATGVFTATVTVPADQAPGLYQSAIRVAGGDQEAVIPVVVNVPATVGPGNLNFVFGGEDPSGTLYDNSFVRGGFDWLGNGAQDQGDWRMYFVDVPDETGLPEGTRWFVDTQWKTAATDIDTLILGPVADSYTKYGAFGPYTLDVLGGSQETLYDRSEVFGWGRWAYTWQTATGGPQETVVAPVKSGLNMIALQNVLYGGMEPTERFTGTVGTISVTPYPISATVEALSGSVQFTFTSSLDISGLGYGGSFGLSKPTLYEGQAIVQGVQKLHRFTVGDSALLEITLSTPDPVTAPDLDLYLYRAIGGKWVQVASSGTATSDEFIRMVRPTAGQYMAVVYGYTVIGAGTYDLKVRSVEGHDLTVTGLPTGAIEAGVPYALELGFSKTSATGTYEGIILLGTDKSPNMMQVPVQITFDTPSLAGSTKDAEEVVAWGDTLHYTIIATNSGVAAGMVSIEDELPQSDNLEFLSGTLSATKGTVHWEPAENEGHGVVTWDGELAAGETVTITFQMATSLPALGASETITNTVTFEDGVNPAIVKTAVTEIKSYLKLRLPMLMKSR